MEIHALKISLVQQLLSTNSMELLQKLQSVLQDAGSDVTEDAFTLTPEQHRILDERDAQYERGETVSREEVERSIEQMWRDADN